MNKHIELAKKNKYEGAGCFAINENKEFLFLISSKDNKLQAEIPGGKIEECDNFFGNFGKYFSFTCDPKYTAIREFEEETGIKLTLNNINEHSKMTTTGGTTGEPSYQYLTYPLENLSIKKLEKFIDHTWSKLYRENNKWFIIYNNDKIPVRKYNTYCLDQNVFYLTDYIVLS